jgi:hypothetical protein
MWFRIGMVNDSSAFANGRYVLLFTDESDTFRDLSIFETTKKSRRAYLLCLSRPIIFCLKKGK